MKYLNPYKVAEFIGFYELNSAVFKKFKKRLYAELELNDNEITINNVVFQKNDIYEILSNIDKDKDLLNVYKVLYFKDKKLLDDFLSGSLDITFTNLKKIKDILSTLNNENNEKVFNFILPYLVNSLTEVYKNAFAKNDINLLQIETFLDDVHYEKIFEFIYQILKGKEKQLLNLVRSQKYDFYDVKNIVGNIETINALPEYFAKLRNDIAQIIRSLSVIAWNNNQNINLAFNLINYALKFNISDKLQNEFSTNKNELKRLKSLSGYGKTELLENINIILNDNFLSLPNKIDELISNLKENISIVDNEICRVIYNSIHSKYLKNQRDLTEDNKLSLIRLFNYLLDVSSDWQLKQSLREKIKFLNEIDKIREQKKQKKINYYESKLDIYRKKQNVNNNKQTLNINQQKGGTKKTKKGNLDPILELSKIILMGIIILILIGLSYQ
jgi:hypothetical protein